MDELLHNYQRSRSPEDFRLIVERHLNAVYSHALRQMRDPGAAEDVAQAVFVLLSRKAASLPDGVVLGAWLFRATQYACLAARRAAARRARHEREAAAMRSEMHEMPEKDLQDALDDAIGNLSRSDREAVLLRYHEGHTAAEVGQRLGISEEAARKRLSRAVDRLREILGRRGVTVPSVALVAVLEHAFSEQASAHLVGAITAAVTGAAAPSTGVLMILKGACKMILLQNMKVAAMVVGGVLLVGAAVPVGIKAFGEAPKPAPATQPAVAQANPNNEAVAREIEDCLHRMLAALKADNYQAVCTEIHSTAPEDRNAFKAALRVSMAMEQLRTASKEKFPDASDSPWDRDMTISEVLERVLSLPPDPRDTITVEGDHAIATSQFDPAEVFGDKAAAIPQAAQWVGAPNHFVRENGRWLWDTDRSFVLKVTGMPTASADPYAQDKLAVKVLNAICDATRQTADGIRKGTYATHGAAVGAFGTQVGTRLADLKMTNFSIEMVPAKK